MAYDISKLCSDFLRKTYDGLKASHARELVAAFFGYKSHAALLSESTFSPNAIRDADVLAPAINLIDHRRTSLTDLADSVPSGTELAEDLVEFLEDNQHFRGSVWSDCVDFASYMQDEYLPEKLTAGDLDDELADTIAETNANFEEPIYDNIDVDETPCSIIFTVTGEYRGEHDEEGGKLFCGDSIEFQFVYEMRYVAGRTCFAEPTIIERRSNVKSFDGPEQDLISYRNSRPKGLEDLFAEDFRKTADQRGFKKLEQKLPFGSNIYSNADWVIGSLITTMFPDTTVTINLSLQNPPESNPMHRLKYEATWSQDKRKWLMSGSDYTNSELISYAFDQMLVKS